MFAMRKINLYRLENTFKNAAKINKLIEDKIKVQESLSVEPMRGSTLNQKKIKKIVNPSTQPERFSKYSKYITTAPKEIKNKATQDLINVIKSNIGPNQCILQSALPKADYIHISDEDMTGFIDLYKAEDQSPKWNKDDYISTSDNEIKIFDVSQEPQSDENSSESNKKYLIAKFLT